MIDLDKNKGVKNNPKHLGLSAGRTDLPLTERETVLKYKIQGAIQEIL